VTAAPTLVGHQWRLVAPWWHWPPRPDDGGEGPAETRRSVRTSAPVLQKYDVPDLVNAFLRDPQRRLAFDPAVDAAGQVRKLFLASHHRHYLVIASLHCDAAGFPHARRGDVCAAGFVIRRRTADLPAGSREEIARARRRHVIVARRRQVIERRLAEAPAGLHAAALRARLQPAIDAERAAAVVVSGWAAAVGDDRKLEGWVSGDAGAAWAEVDEVPDELTEAAYPLSPLVADPTDPDHDAAGESLYFGVVPTGSSDVDAGGQARFDDEAVYEIRCWARRHQPQCPRDRHCRCPLTWSEPTEAFRLAAHLDLEGTTNRPVTVQMPDRFALEADALRLGPGGAAGIRFRSPPGSALNFTSEGTDAKPADPNSQVQICSFAIPLLTIVAFFVFKLFLPIVVLVFQLWFLLGLRFCIPPVTLGTGVAAKIAALGPNPGAQAAAAFLADTEVTAAMAKILGTGQLRDKVKALDAQQQVVIARAALVAEPKVRPAAKFAARLKRSEVVRP
jgi:hypothetical protein